VSHLLKVRVVFAALLALTTFAAAGPRAFADQSNAATVFLGVSGGNAAAIAACLNVAKDHGGYNVQKNDCQNKAVARGGDVMIKGAKIVGISTDKRHVGKTSLSRGVVAVTLRGGSATAVAACVNVAGGGDNVQLNKCTNTAIAAGGNVILNHVTIENVVSA
jgi:hypothetical protein